MLSKPNDATPAATAPLFEPGRNCWRIERASRAAFLVDGDAYFKAFVQAARKAQRSLLITGWDFHSRTRLLCPEDNDGKELLLGEFLNELAHERRELQVHILIWDYPVIFGMEREWAPIYGLGWRPHRRVHFRYDNTHPTGGSHHQKIVVIDDTMAFNGGIDLTARRWDRCAHAANESQRVAQGTAYPPFHDMMMAVEGDVATALGEVVRDRWRVATGETLKSASAPRMHWRPRRWRAANQPLASAWPERLVPDVRDVEIAISRTSPPVNGHEGVREVEALYVDMITAARQHIYLENQYFTADKIGDALEARLGEAHGPEIIVVLRKLSHGWLEELTMEALRTRMIARLKAADRYDRLRVVYPYIEGLKEGTCIDVHSKMIIVDDDVVRIGSANVANRSMGLDTECDLTIHAAGRADVQEAIRNLRAALLAEHLGTTHQAVQRAVERRGALRDAIAELHDESRTLRPLEDPPQNSSLLSVVSIADPEKPVALADLVKIFSAGDDAAAAQVHAAPVWRNIAVAAVVLAGLAALWQLTPVSDLFDAQRIVSWAREFGGKWWAPWVTMLAYTPAVLIMFPRSPITLFAVVAFGPWMGFIYAMVGLEFSAWVTYLAGQLLNRDTVRRISGRKLNDVIQVLQRRGLIAVTALRLVPLAPFSIEGVIAGAVGIKLWHFLVGSAIGMLPGTLAATVFGRQLQSALEGESGINYWLLVAVLAAVAVATWLVRRWLLNSTKQFRPIAASSVHDADTKASAASRHGVSNVNVA